MPKKIKNFVIHLNNPRIKPKEMKKYLEDHFGPSWDDAHENQFWYLGRNYSRPYDESHIEITFYCEPNKKHDLMMFVHPFTIININADEWFTVSDQTFNNLFEI